jgi:hypothetical protein
MVTPQNGTEVARQGAAVVSDTTLTVTGQDADVTTAGTPSELKN